MQRTSSEGDKSSSNLDMEGYDRWSILYILLCYEKLGQVGLTTFSGQISRGSPSAPGEKEKTRWKLKTKKQRAIQMQNSFLIW